MPVWHELRCYSSVALGHGGDNANHLYLYLWSVCGKLLVNDSGSSKQTVYSAVSSAVLSHTGALCPQKSQLCVMRGNSAYIQRDTVNNTVTSRLENTRLKEENSSLSCDEYAEQIIT